MALTPKRVYHEKHRTRDWDTIVPHFVVTALAHDLGKIPTFRIRHVDKYTVADHPLISASLIDEVFERRKKKMIPEIRDAILGHHRATEQDMLHIALATVAGADVLVSWNFQHVVRLDKIQQFNGINVETGYKPLAIYSPREVTTHGREE